MKLTRNELLDILATILAEEVHKYCEMTHTTALEEFATIVLMGSILSRVEKELFK